jgi:hypothetical protein
MVTIKTVLEAFVIFVITSVVMFVWAVRWHNYDNATGLAVQARGNSLLFMVLGLLYFGFGVFLYYVPHILRRF